MINTRRLKTAVLSAMTIILFLSASACSGLFYQPSKNLFIDPVAEHQEVKFLSSDGVELTGWFFPAKSRRQGAITKGIVVQLHGNGRNISAHFALLAWLTEAGYDFFTFDYRGYGASDGEPSREGMQRDALAAIRWAAGKERPKSADAKDILLYGQSLGGAITLSAVDELTDSAIRGRIRAVVIESSFHSYQSIARVKLAQFWLTFPFQPLAWVLISDDFSPENAIARVSPIPLLVIHGKADPIVPFEFGQKIFRLAREPKVFWEIPNGGHVDSMIREKGRYRERLVEFLDNPVRNLQDLAK